MAPVDQRVLALLPLLTVLLAAAVGCDSEEPAASAELPAEWHVPDGASLAGATFPVVEGALVDGIGTEVRDGWTAVMLIDDDPAGVWDDLAEQANAMGFPMGGAQDACVWQTTDGAISAAEEPVPDADQVTGVSCNWGTAVDPLWAELIWREPNERLMFVQVRPDMEPSEGWELPDGEVRALPPEASDVVPQLDSADQLPEEGEVYAEGVSCAGHEIDLALPEGTKLVVPPAPVGHLFRATVIEVGDGGAERALRKMSEQLRATDGGETTPTTLHLGPINGAEGAFTLFAITDVPANGTSHCAFRSSKDGEFILSLIGST